MPVSLRFFPPLDRRYPVAKSVLKKNFIKMITSIRASDGQKVVARDSQKHDGPFFCPKCQGEAILRKGRVKVHMFESR